VNRCKTCKHWDRSPPWLTDRSTGGCYPGREVGGFCRSPHIYEGECDAFQPDALVYSYNEGGAFWTGPEFGCVHHRDGHSIEFANEDLQFLRDILQYAHDDDEEGHIRPRLEKLIRLIDGKGVDDGQ